jgi:ADP-ribose pyrophosphatase
MTRLKTEDVDESVQKRTTVFHGRYLDAEIWDVTLADGKPASREIVRVKNAAAVFMTDDRNRVCLVKQHRPAIGRTILEVPAGLVDKGEDMEAAAIRECEEETGWRPASLERLLTYAHSEGYSTGWITLFRGLRPVQTGKIKLDPTERLEAVWVPWNELEELIKKNEIVDSKTLLSFFLSSSKPR